jgi:hypothetical protein
MVAGGVTDSYFSSFHAAFVAIRSLCLSYESARKTAGMRIEGGLRAD